MRAIDAKVMTNTVLYKTENLTYLESQVAVVEVQIIRTVILGYYNTRILLPKQSKEEIIQEFTRRGFRISLVAGNTYKFSWE
jgi:hypothetical protein